MTTLLQELDEVLVKVVDKQFDNMLDATRVGLDCAIFLQTHAAEIRAALVVQAKLNDGWVMVPCGLPNAPRAYESCHGVIQHKQAAPPAGKEEQDDAR